MSAAHPPAARGAVRYAVTDVSSMKPPGRSITFRDAFVFLVPALLVVNAKFEGRLFFSELLLLAALPFLVAEKRFPRAGPWPATLVAAALLWLWAQIVTDLYRATPPVDFLRGWLNIAFTVIDLVAILMLISGQRRRIVIFTTGLALGYTLVYRFNPNPYAAIDAWKFGVAIPITLLICLFSCLPTFHQIRFLSSIPLVMAGILNFALGFRSLGGVCLLAGAYVTAQAFSRRAGSLRITPLRLVSVCLIGIAFASLLVAAYGRASREGFLGAPAAQRYRQESAGKFGVLLGGRPELFASSSAIADSPLIGHGSWAKDPKYTNELLSLLYRNGYQPNGGLQYAIQHSNYLIPSHSFLFQSWVDAGLLGAVFWMIVLALTSTTLIIAFRTRTSLSPLIAFLAILLVWNIFFSPYGADQRIVAMFSVATLLTCRTLPIERRREVPTRGRLGVASTEPAGSQARAW